MNGTRSTPTGDPSTYAAELSAAVPVLRSAGIDSPLTEARDLLCWAAGVTREDVARDPNLLLTARSVVIFRKAIELRSLRRPVSYITGERWFYGRSFKINRAVLIPRPETELLVEFALRHAPPGAAVADIGTGSGCIAVSVAAERPDVRVWATDLFDLALHVAAKNRARYGLADRLTIVEGDLYAPLSGLQFDIIVSNPPYVRPDDLSGLMPEVRDYEPEIALSGRDSAAGPTGTAILRRLFAEAGPYLKPGGRIAVEIGAGQSAEVLQIARDAGFIDVAAIRDYAGIDRVIAARRPLDGAME